MFWASGIRQSSIRNLAISSGILRLRLGFSLHFAVAKMLHRSPRRPWVAALTGLSFPRLLLIRIPCRICAPGPMTLGPADGWRSKPTWQPLAELKSIPWRRSWGAATDFWKWRPAGESQVASCSTSFSFPKLHDTIVFKPKLWIPPTGTKSGLPC